MHNKDYSLIKENSDETIVSWSKRHFIGKELQEKLEKADALIIPSEGYHDDGDIRHFPEGTEHLLSFLQRNNRGDANIDICIEDTDYKELAQHADLQIIAAAIANKLGAPVLVNLISEYIKQRRGRRIEDTTVKSSLTISDVNNGRSISLTYEGPASTYETIMTGAVKEVINEVSNLHPASRMIGNAPDNQTNNEIK
jgi:hypothetical protein